MYLPNIRRPKHLSVNFLIAMRYQARPSTGFPAPKELIHSLSNSGGYPEGRPTKDVLPWQCEAYRKTS